MYVFFTSKGIVAEENIHFINVLRSTLRVHLPYQEKILLAILAFFLFTRVRVRYSLWLEVSYWIRCIITFILILPHFHQVTDGCGVIRVRDVFIRQMEFVATVCNHLWVQPFRHVEESLVLKGFVVHTIGQRLVYVIFDFVCLSHACQQLMIHQISNLLTHFDGIDVIDGIFFLHIMIVMSLKRHRDRPVWFYDQDMSRGTHATY